MEATGAHATDPAPVFEHLSVLDLFKVGIGPSSSHTVGPMRAAADFTQAVAASGRIDLAHRVQIDLFGSLGATGSGHATDTAVMLGLSGFAPDTVETASIAPTIARIREREELVLAGQHTIPFNPGRDTIFRPLTMRPEHPNAMRLTLYDAAGEILETAGYYSIGGGFVMRHDEGDVLTPVPEPVERVREMPYPFTTGEALLEHCRASGLTIAELMLENERAWREPHETVAALRHIWQVMCDCVDAGISIDGVLPGGLKVKRRAKAWHDRLIAREANRTPGEDRLDGMEWVNLFALAVNEENAAGNRVVTAPTNGAAGIIPAVMHYYDRFVHVEGSDADGLPWGVRFLLTAGAIGIIIKSNASISGAEVGCQGEVGSACAMAAAGFADVIGASPEQIENAAEIGIEHNLGLTCDPVGGLVQIPCIERNAMASVKAINAARMSIHGDGSHHISLDTAVETMRATGADMSDKYKETAMGGLAVAYVEC